MVEHVDPDKSNSQYPSKSIEEIDPDLIECYPSSVSGFNETTRYTHDKSYCVYNMARRAGRAELKAQGLAACALMRRIYGEFYINFPSNTVVLAMKGGRTVVFWCIDRAKDEYAVDLGSGVGIDKGAEMADLMNDLCIGGGCDGYVIFSLDDWRPGRVYEESVEWFCVPWKLARTLGPLDSDKTIELEEFLLSEDHDSDQILSCGDAEDAAD